MSTCVARSVGGDVPARAQTGRHGSAPQTSVHGKAGVPLKAVERQTDTHTPESGCRSVTIMTLPLIQTTTLIPFVFELPRARTRRRGSCYWVG